MKHRLFQRMISLLVTLVLLLGMFPVGAMPVQAAEAAQPETIVADFRAFAKEAAQQDWWDALPSTDSSIRFLGRVTAAAAMTKDQEAAYESMLAYLEENEAWSIDETASNFKGWFKRVYFNTSEDIPWGLNYYTYFHAGSSVPERSKLALTIKAEAEGWYRLELDAFRSSSYYTQSQPLCHGGGGGGGHVNVYVNGDLVHEDYSFDTGSYGNTGRYYGSVDNMGAVWLNEGENAVVLDSIYAYNGPTTVESGRCNISLNSMTFEPLEGLNVLEGTENTLDLTTDWLAFTDVPTADTHSVVSDDENVAEASFEGGMLVLNAGEPGDTELSVYEGDTLLCVIPVTVEALINEAKTPIVVDFKAFAKEASTQSWWDDLAATDANTRYIGRYANAVAPTAAQKAAYAEMQAYLEEYTDWNIDEDLSNFTNWWKRAYFNASNDVPWGVSYWCYYHGNSTTPERAKLALTVTAKESGWYAMELDAFRSNVNYSPQSMTHGGGGGGFADVYVNGQKVYADYSFSGRSYSNAANYYGAVNHVGKVWLNEGENSVYLNSTHAFDSETTVVSGRCNINLNSISFEPLGGEVLKAGASRVLDLRTSYLSFTDTVTEEALSSDKDVVEASLDGSMLTLTALQAGEAEITVGDVVIPVTVEEAYGESYDFSADEFQLTGDSASKEFTIEVSEDGWYEPVLHYVRQNAGGKVSVYVDEYYLGTINTYDSDNKLADFSRLRRVELTQGEHILRLAVTGKDSGLASNTAKIRWNGLELVPAEAPAMRLVAGSICEKRLRTVQTPIIVSGMMNSAVGADWEVTVSDEAVLTAQIVPATLTTDAMLQVTGTQACDDAWVEVTANLGGVEETVTVPVQILETSKLVSAEVSVKGVETSTVARATTQEFAFDMVGEDGDAVTAAEVDISYAMSQEGVIEIDEEANTFFTLANGDVTVTVTVQQNDLVFTQDLALTVADAGENTLEADISSFDNASLWNGLTPASETQWLSAQVVDDGTGNMALKLELNPNGTQNGSVTFANVPKNGHFAPMELGHLYEMSFRVKVEGYKRAEGAKYDLRVIPQIYDYFSNSASGVVDEIYNGTIVDLTALEDGQWTDME